LPHNPTAAGLHGASIADAPSLAASIITDEIIHMKIGTIMVALQIDATQARDLISLRAGG
jgi:hypothetical protein